MKIREVATKTVSALLVISIIMVPAFFLAPKKSRAIFGVGDIVIDPSNLGKNTLTSIWSKATAISSGTTAAWTAKEWTRQIGMQLLKVAAKRVLAEMTKSTINWINSGFHGSPLFLENSDSFFNDIAKTEVKNLVDMIGYDSLRHPYGKQTALNIIDSYKSQFEINAQYSLSKVINDPELLNRYRNDFNYGGWNGFLINTQYPQNNYLGYNMMIQQELSRKLAGVVQAPAEKARTTLQQGMGFLSPQTCPSNPAYNNLTNQFQRPSYKNIPFDVNKYPGASGSLQWERENNAAKAAWQQTNTCPGGLVATTPGSVVANQIFSATNAPFLSTALDGAIGNSVAAIFDALLNKLAKDGLSSLKSTANPSPAVDSWSYEGGTLSGGSVTSDGVGGYTTDSIWGGANVDTVGNDPLLVNSQNPQNVSVDVNKSVVATISGGTEPYNIQTESSEGVAVSIISSTGLIITGVAKGETYLVVKDSSPTPKTVRVNIKVIGKEDFLTSPENISIDITGGGESSAEISGGTAPYFVESILDESVVTVPAGETKQIPGTTLAITGIKSGQTSIILKDSSNPVQIAQVNVTVTNPSDPLGTCVAKGQINEGISKSVCESIGGDFK